jgi:hypothetical protein
LASAGFRLAAADYALARLGWQVEYREFTDVRLAKMTLSQPGARHCICESRTDSLPCESQEESPRPLRRGVHFFTLMASGAATI